MNHIDSTHQHDTSVFGFWLYIMSDCLLFASLFATYAVLRQNIAYGPMAADIFSLSFVFLETLLLLSSSFTIGLALIFAHYNKQKQILIWLAATALLGGAFIFLEMSEFVTLLSDGHSWTTSAFLSSFFTLVGTHGLHVTLGLVWMSVLALQIFERGITNQNITRLVCLALFWHFLDIVWIFIFSFVYLIPLIL